MQIIILTPALAPLLANISNESLLQQLDYRTMTVAEATAFLRSWGMTIRRAFGEYRVSFSPTRLQEDSNMTRSEAIARSEALAYYAHDLHDALATARIMAGAPVGWTFAN